MATRMERIREYARWSRVRLAEQVVAEQDAREGLVAELEAQSTARERAEEWIWRHGEHGDECQFSWEGPEGDCSCGLSDLLVEIDRAREAR